MYKLHRQKGQGLVEFGIGLLFFIPIMVIIFMACVYSYNIMAVNTMARDSARQISTCTNDTAINAKVSALQSHYSSPGATTPILYDWDGKMEYDGLESTSGNVQVKKETINSVTVYYVNVYITANNRIGAFALPNWGGGLAGTINGQASVPMENYGTST